jgi:hypothetical protein
MNIDVSKLGNLADFVHHPGQFFPAIMAVALIAAVILVVVHLFLAVVGGRAPRARKRFNIWEKLVYLATLVSVAILGVTSFYTVFRFGGMHGWWLFAHMFGAGAMTGVLPLVALTWCGANRFGRAPQSGDEEAPLPRFFGTARVLFWLFLLAGFIVMITMLVSMLPIFGSDGLRVLLDIHRYAGLLAVVTLFLHLYCVLLQCLQLR